MVGLCDVERKPVKTQIPTPCVSSTIIGSRRRNGSYDDQHSCLPMDNDGQISEKEDKEEEKKTLRIKFIDMS